MKTCSIYIGWSFVSARCIATTAENVALTKIASFFSPVFINKTGKNRVLGSEDLCVPRRQPKTAYDFL